MLKQEQLTRFLATLGDNTRLQILFVLGEHERLNVTEIASHFNVRRPTISHHLKILRDADVVGREQVGQEVYYWLNRELVVAELRALADTIEHCDD